jgi:hypothetical protein
MGEVAPERENSTEVVANTSTIVQRINFTTHVVERMGTRGGSIEQWKKQNVATSSTNAADGRRGC